MLTTQSSGRINLLSAYFLSSPMKAVNEILNKISISNLIEITEKWRNEEWNTRGCDWLEYQVLCQALYV